MWSKLRAKTQQKYVEHLKKNSKQKKNNKQQTTSVQRHMAMKAIEVEEGEREEVHNALILIRRKKLLSLKPIRV